MKTLNAIRKEVAFKILLTQELISICIEYDIPHFSKDTSPLKEQAIQQAIDNALSYVTTDSFFIDDLADEPYDKLMTILTNTEDMLKELSVDLLSLPTVT